MKIKYILTLFFILICSTDLSFSKDYKYKVECPRDGINIRIGPGTNYSKDASGQLFKGENIYVLDEKDGWLHFRVTANDVGWSGWVFKRLIVTNNKKSTKTKTNNSSNYNKKVQVLYDSGLLKKFNVDANEAWVDPYIWNQVVYDTKLGIGITLAKICDNAGSTGRITFINNYTGAKIARYSQAYGYKVY